MHEQSLGGPADMHAGRKPTPETVEQISAGGFA